MYYSSMYYRITTFEGHVLGAMEDNSPAASFREDSVNSVHFFCQAEVQKMKIVGANASTFAGAPLDFIDVLLKYWIDPKLHKSDHLPGFLSGGLLALFFSFRNP